MKRIYIIVIVLLVVANNARAQSKFNLGAGYFGNTLTYPGLVLEAEWETSTTEKAALPLRIDLGFYAHKRYNTGIFADVNYGFRQYFKSGIFLEESIGVGLLATFLSNDGTYEVGDAGELTETSNFGSVDFMPSLTLGIGYNLTHGKGTANYIWLRPKLFWQYPHKTTSTYNGAVQLGFSKTIGVKRVP